MTGLQVALCGGLLIGLAAALLVYRLAPSDPHLGDVLDRLAPAPLTRGTVLDGSASSAGTSTTLADRLGGWALRTLPGGAWVRTPRRDLAILQISETRFYGEKVLWAGLGLIFIPSISTILTLAGLPIPLAIPALGSIMLAAVGWFVPNYNAVDDAKRARVEFLRALGAYIELVALERRSGASGHQALAVAADVGDSWVFTRIATELRRARYASRAPWESLHDLSDELGVPELDDLADIMQQSSQDGAQIYTSLRARANGLRSAMLSAEIGKANAASERMYIPASLLGVVFMAILITPALLRFTS
ncbi:hypothetical protein [Nocardioides okcheonensis]|uniref:hypothetical protein n=1 Tax=Nocardioides okcheonensis TaxID=2894081 RepID=UPI001E5F7EA4|nr:hypothetical protein [Nocardioides okcheonensis]UFN45210.1 hypothetical protein LN652_03060 [Nocardioides okcheonensis]